MGVPASSSCATCCQAPVDPSWARFKRRADARQRGPSSTTSSASPTSTSSTLNTGSRSGWRTPSCAANVPTAVQASLQLGGPSLQRVTGAGPPHARRKSWQANTGDALVGAARAFAAVRMVSGPRHGSGHGDHAATSACWYPSVNSAPEAAVWRPSEGGHARDHKQPGHPGDGVVHARRRADVPVVDHGQHRGGERRDRGSRESPRPSTHSPVSTPTVRRASVAQAGRRGPIATTNRTDRHREAGANELGQPAEDARGATA